VTVGSKGGSFGPDGWTTTGDEDALWFLIPATLPTARVEVSVKGISPANLDGEEHDILVTYGDTDRAEPVDYAPAYRNNNFKTNLRIFGALSAAAGGRPQGANKLELRTCPAGLPGHSEACPPGCTNVFEVAYLGGKPEAVPWVATTSYRMKLAWSPGTISYTRGVEPAVSIGYPGTLAPKALRVRIGSPRHGAGSVNRMPKGITFSNLLIAGDPGAPTPVCGGTVTPDAGTSDASCSLRTEPLAKVSDLYRTTYKSCGGLRIAQFWIGDVVDPVVPNLSGGYEAGRLFVGDQSCTPGETKTLTSAHGSLDCARSKVTTSGDTLIIDWAVKANGGLALLPRPFFVDAKGGAPETRLGWTRVGTYGDSVGVEGEGDAVAVDDAGMADAGADAKRNAASDDLGGGELACSCRAVGGRANPSWWVVLALLFTIRPTRGGRVSGTRWARSRAPRAP
jgi:hypothetical protein